MREASGSSGRSSLWETKPMYVLDQDSFINGACEVNSSPSSIVHVLRINFL